MHRPVQLYNEQGVAIKGVGKVDVLTSGDLHGSAHVWIWRKTKSGIEVLVQKRALSKHTWPGCYDISAAGHIDLNETPIIAAIREIKEEIGLVVSPWQLRLITVERRTLNVPNTALIENEFNWVYLYEMTDSEESLTLDDGEVESLHWKAIDVFKEETIVQDSRDYVEHGRRYYETVISHIIN